MPTPNYSRTLKLTRECLTRLNKSCLTQPTRVEARAMGDLIIHLSSCWRCHGSKAVYAPVSDRTFRCPVCRYRK